MAAHYVRLAVALASIDALVYTPPRNISMYDAWLYVDDGAFTAYYLAKPANASGSGAKPAWDRVMTITSDDGATWSDAGVAVAKAPGAKWLGSGSVWRTGDAFVLSYSQEGYGCAGDPGGGPTGDPTWCQSLFFATAPTPLALDDDAAAPSYGEGYEIGGRWDCVAALRDGDGGFMALGARFPRIWGSDVTGGPLLATHHQMTGPDCSGDGGLECPVYLGLVKRATLGADGGLRATWFEGNDNLRGEELARVADADLDRGLWLEGTLGAGGGFAVGLAAAATPPSWPTSAASWRCPDAPGPAAPRAAPVGAATLDRASSAPLWRSGA
ncbi:hypothetical protein JL720_4001 [Aureococcus anophagefferens]|nr:hypothetical protein JL720_4001 [Aureococcus anophagefferens]